MIPAGSPEGDGFPYLLTGESNRRMRCHALSAFVKPGAYMDVACIAILLTAAHQPSTEVNATFQL
jgi:hypothetical protein